MNYLLLTLGHGSSALFVYNNGRTVIGYEQERLSGIKSDSQFPMDAINEIRHNVGSQEMKNCKVYVSHWFNSIDKIVPNKYITATDLVNLTDISNDITFCSKEFTHHDAHAYSAFAFFKDNIGMKDVLPSTTGEPFIIVADGFGMDEEVLSIYKITRQEYTDKREPILVKRINNYFASVGLMYQYATSFCEMKENQDEYKFLGYEPHIDEFLCTEQIDALNHSIGTNVEYLLKFFAHETKSEVSNKICDTDKLKLVKNYWHKTFTSIFEGCLSGSFSKFEARCIIAYFIQQSIEIYFNTIIADFRMKSVIVTGGCFYNVKLNNHILCNIQGIFCAMPLAGDQGAAIGFYEKYSGKKFPFGDLCFGKRRMEDAKKLFSSREKENIYYFSKKEERESDIAYKIAIDIANGNLVNIVHGNMEFGPRALCNTSTLFLPTVENAVANNCMNKRNEVMPCAPVCTLDGAEKLFNEKQLHAVVGSLRYMVCTLDYKRPFTNQYGGVMHKCTLDGDTYSGRPQIVYGGQLIYDILRIVKEVCDAVCIVNTSFNAHGRPIVFSLTDILLDFYFQKEHAKERKSPKLYVIE